MSNIQIRLFNLTENQDFINTYKDMIAIQGMRANDADLKKLDKDIKQRLKNLNITLTGGYKGVVNKIRSKVLEPQLTSSFKGLGEGLTSVIGTESQPDYAVMKGGVLQPEESVEYKLLASPAIIESGTNNITNVDRSIKIGGRIVSQLNKIREGLNIENILVKDTIQKKIQPLRGIQIENWYSERTGKKRPSSKAAGIAFTKEANLAYEEYLRKPEEGNYTLDSIKLLIGKLRAFDTDTVLDYLKKSEKETYQALKDKSHNVMITFPYIDRSNGGEQYRLPTAMINFSAAGKGWFSGKHFYLKYEPKSTGIDFKLYIETKIQKQIEKVINDNLKSAVDEILGSQINKFNRAVTGMSMQTVNVDTRSKGLVGLDFEAGLKIFGHGKPGSIPQGGVSARIPRRKSSAFTSRTAAARQTLAQTKVPSMGNFISNKTIADLTKREMMRRMPIGPVGGPPLSSRVLTYRTGRFVRSLQVIADLRSQTIQYYYNPNYWIHEATSRNPRNLIDSSINSVAKTLFGKRFELIKANQSL